MGTFVGTISHRGSQANTVPRMVEFFNKITEAFVSCGMVKVPEGEFPGQAGEFVEGTPWQTGQTQITALSTAVGFTIVGKNLFKHPTRGLYIQVDYIDYGFSATTSRAHYVRYGLATGLVAGELEGLTFISPQSSFTSITQTTAQLPTTYAPLWASCGDDHFWICSRPVQVLSGTTSYYTYPNSISANAIAVLFSEQDPEVMVAMAPAEVTGNNSGTFGAQFGTYSSLAACRYWVAQGGIWNPVANGSLGFVPDPSTPTSAAGVRVARGSKVVDGKVHRFSLGFVNSAAVNDGAVIDVALTGEQESYRACWGFGPASPSFSGATAGDLSGTILPWAA